MGIWVTGAVGSRKVVGGTMAQVMKPVPAAGCLLPWIPVCTALVATWMQPYNICVQLQFWHAEKTKRKK